MCPYHVAEKCDLEHWTAVLRERRAKGLASANTRVDHPLIGRTLLNRETGNVYVVEKAHIHWLWGRYVALLIQHNDSHTLVWWDNISCSDRLVLDGIARTRAKYALLD